MSDFYSNGTRWGRIDDNGEIFSSTGTYLGTLDKYGKFNDSHGNYMGSINSKGEIHDASYKYLGRVWSNGELYNDVGDYIGMFPYYNGRIGSFSLNDSETNSDSISNNNPSPPKPPKPPTPDPGPIIPTPTDDIDDFFMLCIYGLGFLLILAGYLKIKEVFYTPYTIILIPISLIAALIFLLITEETECTSWESIKQLFFINFILCISWTLVLNILILNQDITWAIVDILINYLVSSLVFTVAMTILSLIVSIILRKLIGSEGILKFLLLFFIIFTCVLIAIYTKKLRTIFDFWEDTPTTETATETTTTPESTIIEDKIKQISANYNDIQNNLDSMEIDTYETGKLYYHHKDVAKMILYTYNSNYTMEAFYKNSVPNFIYLEEKILAKNIGFIMIMNNSFAI